MKKIIGKIHLALGLASGVVLFVVCLSGAFISFTEEALDIVNRDYLHVPKRDQPKASIASVISTYQAAYPQEEMFIMNAYREENRSFDFFSAVKTGKIDARGNEEFAGFKMVYANPYTGDIMRVDKGTLETIIILVTLHTSLFMGEFGRYVIRISTLIFLIQLFGGIYLWWPRSRNARSQAFKMKSSAGRKRRNYDLHRVLGFYTSFILLILVGTGLFMAWDFVKHPVVDSLGGQSALLDPAKVPQPVIQKSTRDYPYDQLFAKLLDERPAAQQFTFFMPESDTITILNGRTNDRTSFLNFETGKYFQVNRYTGEKTGGADLTAIDRNNEIMAGALLIHMGFWGGMPTKILTSLVGLVGASLPITGFLIWRGRRRKERKLGVIEKEKVVGA